MSSTPEKPLLTFIGPEGSGKTTMCQHLARRLGGTALVVRPWASLDNFLQSPEAFAYENQSDALNQTLIDYRIATSTEGGPILADMCPDRAHLIYAWQLFQDGMLDEAEWGRLEEQYLKARLEWGPNYIYLRASLDTLLQRLSQRLDRLEDLEHNMKMVGKILKRWEEIVSDPMWRQDKNILELNSEKPVEELCDAAELWFRDIVKGEENI